MSCDCCGLTRKTRSVPSGRDPGGDVFHAEVCFLCEVEGRRGRYFDRKTGRYARPEPPSLTGSADDEIPW